MRLNPRTRLFARALPLAACALIINASASAFAQTPDAPRRTRGPIAGPAIKLPRGEGANVEQPDAAKDEGQRVVVAPQKWEYCAITGFEHRQKGYASPSAYVAVVRYFPNNTEEIEGPLESEALANALAKLGDDGWELVAVKVDFQLRDGNGDTHPSFYFKRPKRQD